jgi:DNA-binding beta-propeller fold protein YncE
MDGASNVWKTTIAVGMYPTALVCFPESGRAYVANEGSMSISVLRDTMPSGVEEQHADPRSMGAATVVRAVLFLPLASSVEREVSGVLLDVSGRKVMDLLPGANDVRALAPGVYFVREAQAQAQAQAIQKVVITR